MKPTDRNHPWQRLARLARTAESDLDVSAPYGFSGRVAAIAFAQPREVPSLFEAFAFRALGIACLLMLASFAVNYSGLSSGGADLEAAIEGEPAVALLLDPSR